MTAAVGVESIDAAVGEEGDSGGKVRGIGIGRGQGMT